MRNIFALIRRFYVFLLFLGLQVFSLILLYNSSNYHRAEIITHSSDWVGSIYNYRDDLARYFRLDEINDQLALENALLRAQLPENYFVMDTSRGWTSDTLTLQRYQFRPARVINASVNRDMNYLTLDRGSLGGVRPDMGVITNGSIVGFVTSVSDHFAVVKPVLHSGFVASVKLKGSGDFGELTWPPGDPDRASVNYIPKHVMISIGDTVLTTGYSVHFPANMTVGYVERLEDKAEENFHRIIIHLSTDFRRLNYVQVVSDILREERDSLELQQQITDGAVDPQ